MIDQRQVEPKIGSRLIAILPGAIMVHSPPLAGVPRYETPRSTQVRMLAQCSALASIPADERNALSQSLASSLHRAEYHYQRLLSLRAALEERRLTMPGEVAWDATVPCLHFELQALFGATRLIVDEVLFIAARRIGVSASKATDAPWEAATAFGSAKTLAKIPEVVILRERREWYRTLNAYRNAFFHHGWRFGSGFQPLDVRVKGAEVASMNALILPDQESLRSRGKPSDWTYHNKTSLDDVVSVVHSGLHELLGSLCQHAWLTPVPPPGTFPEEDRPNVVVSLVRPVLVSGPDFVVVPFFSSREKASAFAQFGSLDGLEIAELRTTSLVAGTNAITFSLRGFEDVPDLANAKTIYILLDPDPLTDDWRNVEAAASAMIATKDFSAQGSITPVSLPVSEVMSVYTWRRPETHGWLVP